MPNSEQNVKLTTIDRESPLPLYYQVKRILLRCITDGEFPVGGVLPSESELQNRYGVSRITIRRVLGDLATEGYVTRRRGRGAFILPHRVQDSSRKLGGLFEDLSSQGFEAQSQILENKWQHAPQNVARELALESDQLVLFVKRLIRVAEGPVSISSGYFKVDRNVTLSDEELITGSIFAVLEQKYGIRLPLGDRTLQAAAASEVEAWLLEIRPGTPVLLSQVTVYDEMGRPAAWFSAVYRGDRYKYRCTLTR